MRGGIKKKKVCPQIKDEAGKHAMHAWGNDKEPANDFGLYS